MRKSNNIVKEPAAEAQKWMKSRGWKPQKFQQEAWNAMLDGQEGLVNAPTGSGKTYSLLLPFITQFAGSKEKVTGLRMVWLTPIRALAKEIKGSAERVIADLGVPLTVGIRTGDTSQDERLTQKKETPNLLITTPESLHLMLARKGCTEFFSSLQLFVADEWHELLSTKRGVQAELALSRLKGMAPKLKIWGISATIGNLEEALQVLLGPDRALQGRIIKSQIKKEIEIISVMPEQVELLPWYGHLGVKLLKSLLPVIHQSTSSIIFTNTRAQCEVWYRKLLDEDPTLVGIMAMHHGSISKELRHWVEDMLYEGKLKAVISTSSLDLGVDFAPVETIIQIGGPKGVSRFVQRAGRSGHRPDAKSRIYFLPTNSLELIEAAALRQAIAENYLEAREPLQMCVDVLVQYLVTLSLGDGFDAQKTFHEIKNTYCYSTITQEEWMWVLSFTAHGGTALGSYDDYNRIKLTDGLYRLSNQRIARKHRMSIGTIVSDTLMAVKYNRGGLIGHVEESFMAAFNEGDNFWFAGMSLELIRIKDLTAFVKKSNKTTGRSPAWNGGRLSLTSHMSDMLRRKMTQAAHLLNKTGKQEKPDVELVKIQPLLALQKERSHVPLENEFLIELFETDEGHHAVFYTFEGRLLHEGLAALFAYRIGQLQPITFSFAYNDYGFELLSDQPIPMEEALGSALTDVNQLEQDLFQSINSSELARRKFRDIAAISGLVFKGYPGAPIKDRHLQSSSALIFQVFEDYDKDNLLLRQAFDEVLNYQLEMPRLRAVLQRINHQKIIITRPEKPTPFAFPIMVDRLRDRMSTESIEERVKRMTLDFE